MKVWSNDKDRYDQDSGRGDQGKIWIWRYNHCWILQCNFSWVDDSGGET